MSRHIAADSINPVSNTATNVSKLAIGSGTPVDKYERIAIEATVTGPFTDRPQDAPDPLTIVLSRFGDDVVMCIRTLNCTATAATENAAAISTALYAIPIAYAPEDDKVSVVIPVDTYPATDAPAVVQLSELAVTSTGAIEIKPLHPTTRPGFCTENKRITVHSASLSWTRNFQDLGV
jgi:hypothetical protein